MSGGHFNNKEDVLKDIVNKINDDISAYGSALGPLILEMQKLSIIVSGVYGLAHAYDLFIEEDTGPYEFSEEMRRFERQFEAIVKDRDDEPNPTVSERNKVRDNLYVEGFKAGFQHGSDTKGKKMMNDAKIFYRNVRTDHLFDDWQRAHRRTLARETHKAKKLKVISPPKPPSWWRRAWKRANKKIEVYVRSFITAIVVLLFFWNERER